MNRTQMVARRKQSVSSASSSSVSVAVTPPLATDPPQVSPHGPLGTAVDAPQGTLQLQPQQSQTQLHLQRAYAAPQTRQHSVVVQVVQPQQRVHSLGAYTADGAHPREPPRQRYIIRNPTQQQQQHVIIAPRSSSVVYSDQAPSNVQQFESAQPQTLPPRNASSQFYTASVGPVDQPMDIGYQHVASQQPQQSQVSQLDGGGNQRPVVAGSGLVPRPIVSHRAAASLPMRPNSSYSASASPTPSSQKMPPAGPTRYDRYARYAAPSRGTHNPRPHASSSSSEDSQDSFPSVPPRSSSLHSSSESSLELPAGFPTFAHSQAKVHKVMRNISAGTVKENTRTGRNRASEPQPVLNEKELSRYATEKVDAGLRLDPEVSTALATLTDDLVDDIIGKAVRVARHRGSKQLEKRDVEFVLRPRAPPVRPRGVSSARH